MIEEPVKIITVCKQGLVRSVALADVLKMHFEPVDVIPLGLASNSEDCFIHLEVGCWADWCIAMDQKRYDQLAQQDTYASESNGPYLLLCDVGPDIYHNSRHPLLIEKVWNWARQNADKLGIKEHTRRI